MKARSLFSLSLSLSLSPSVFHRLANVRAPRRGGSKEKKKIKEDISQRKPGRNTLTRWEIRDWFRLNCVFRLNPLALTERFTPLRLDHANPSIAGRSDDARPRASRFSQNRKYRATVRQPARILPPLSCFETRGRISLSPSQMSRDAWRRNRNSDEENKTAKNMLSCQLRVNRKKSVVVKILLYVN